MRLLKKLYHDPGHGGDNVGCIHAGLVERLWVLEISRDLVVALQGFGVQQRLSRESDITREYDDRAQEALEWGAGLVFCHHVNAAPMDDKGKIDPDQDGLICFASPLQEDAMEIGAAIMRAAPRRLLRRKQQTIPAVAVDWTLRAHRVLKPHVQRGLTTVLIEWGFATSPRDRAVLQSASSRPALCAAAAAGLARGLELRG